MNDSLTSMSSARYPKNIRQVAAALAERYGDFDHYNLKEPLDELLFIICSTKTSESSYRRTFEQLKQAFPTPRHLAEAPAEYIAKPIATGGLSGQKSRAIRAILDALATRFGVPTLEPLRDMTDRDAEAFLTALPNVGNKVARCVLLYALGRQVFPVDTHCWRIARRLGWVRRTQKDGRCTSDDADRLQSRIPLELRFSLHVNLISLGREICTASTPVCDACPINHCCRRIGAGDRATRKPQRSRAELKLITPTC
ncbi:MAG: endonuclease III [Candidatus Competibacteraceae bacterium]|nr:endonuclease III [Candidatus Competibacteraceae bacterium]